MNIEIIIRRNFPLILILCLYSLIIGCNGSTINNEKERKAIGIMLDSWHNAAAKADYDSYFSYFNDDAVFIGTDATENWDKKSFMSWCKPHFDKGKTWCFTSLERHVYLDASGKIAWFDELLNTRMKICRGSGVVIKEGNDWKIQQYVLSMTVPNARTDSVISLKAVIEDSIINKLIKR